MKTKLILLVLLMVLFVIFGCSKIQKNTSQQDNCLSITCWYDPDVDLEDYIINYWVFAVKERLFFLKAPEKDVKRLYPDEVLFYCLQAVKKNPRIKTSTPQGPGQEDLVNTLFALQKSECVFSLESYSAKAEE